jgi:heme oxygenase (biliverdin-IX-beta and delta-forming)
MTSVLHSRLRAATATRHLKLEHHLNVLASALSLARYTRIVAVFYGFYEPLERALKRLEPLVPALGFPLRARTELLNSDLLALGIGLQAIAELPRCTHLPHLGEAEHFVGCLYVLEGAGLGGQVIVRSLHRELMLNGRDGTAYFSGEGGSTAARWKTVLEWLDRVGRSELRLDMVVESACETFSSLADWARLQGIAHES